MWVVIPAALFTAGTVLSLLNSKEADELFHTITVDIYNMILAIELVILLGFIVAMLRQRRLLIGTLIKFFRGQKISLARLQMSVAMIPMGVMAARIGFGYNLYALDLWVQITTATLLLFSALLFGLNALFGSKVNVSWRDYRLLIRYNYGKENKDAVVEAMLNDLLDEAEEEALKRIQERIGENLHIEEWRAASQDENASPQMANNIFTAVSDSWDENSLISRFQHLMMDQHMFLHPRLTLDDVADRLNSNKTYVSKLVNNTYNLGFPELINTLRIDYAEQYILSHREAKQDEIARSCGFLSASSFNTTFKKVTGMTPKVWIASMERQKVKE
jgi:AraC-like DNA-binding protein